MTALLPRLRIKNGEGLRFYPPKLAPGELRPITVYVIRNNLDGRCYVGQTRISLKVRLSAHISKGKIGVERARVGHDIVLYGPENFEAEIVALCDTQEEADRVERNWIEQLNSQEPNGYNVEPGGRKGFQQTRQTRERMSRASTGKTMVNHRGELHHRAVLTEQQVIEIRQRFAQGETNKAKLAQEYGIAPSTVRRIVIRKLWRHVP